MYRPTGGGSGGSGPWLPSGSDIYFPSGNVGIGGSTGPSAIYSLSFGAFLQRIGIEPSAVGANGNPLEFFAGPSGNGTDLSGGSLEFSAGFGTGAGTPSGITFSTAVPGASGTTPQGVTARMFITGAGLVGVGVSPGSDFDVNGAIYSSGPHSNSPFNGNPGASGANFIGWSGYWGLRTSTAGDFNVDVYNSGTPKAALTILQDGTAIFSSPVTLKGYTVGTLPAGTIGMTAYVTDLLGPTYLGVAVGGGAVVGPVFYNGTTWVCH